MCSRSVSGSSLLSGYNEDDARETNGRSRREFEEIDAVLYDEEKAKRSSIKKISEEWSSRPHFRIRGRLLHMEKQPPMNLIQSNKQQNSETGASSTFDLFMTNSKIYSSNSNELNVSNSVKRISVLLHEKYSRETLQSIGRSHILDENTQQTTFGLKI